MTTRTPSAVAASLLTLLIGCAKTPQPVENIPRYPSMDSATSLRLLADHARRVQTLSGEGLVTLTRPDGQSVRLDAALAMRPPQHTRLRAWKLGRAVFDLTVTPDGVWILAPDDPRRAEQIRSAGTGAGKLARTWATLAGGFFAEPGLKTMATEYTLIVRREVAGEPTVVCEVNRATLTPRHYRILDNGGNDRFTLTLDKYQTFGDVVWPTRLRARSDSGTVEVNLRQVDVNPDLPDAAFAPPRRAERLP